MKVHNHKKLQKQSVKKNRRFKSAISYVLLLVLILSSFIGSTATIVEAATTTPLDYYKKIEKKNLNNTIDSLTKGYSTYLTAYKNAQKQKLGYDITAEVELGSSLTDDTSFEGLKSIKGSFVGMSNGNTSKIDGTIAVNGKDITKIEALTDLEKALYLRIPELSKSFLKLDVTTETDELTADITNQIENYLKDPISEKTLNKLLKSYSSILIDNISKVARKNNVDVTVDGIKSKNTRLTVTVSESDILAITNGFLTAAKTDTTLKNLLIDLGVCSKTEYNNFITDTLKSITKEQKDLKAKKSNGETILKMYLWVDGKGEIVGRSIAIGTGDEAFSLGYKTSQSGLKMGIDAWLTSGDADIVRIKGSLNNKLTGASGTIKLTYSDYMLYDPIVVDFKVKDLKMKLDSKNSTINGKIEITSKNFNDLALSIKLTGDGEKQSTTIKFLEGTSQKQLATLSMIVKQIDYKKFTLPTSSDKIYDMETELNDYLENTDLQRYLIEIKEKVNITVISNYIDTLLGN